jgi:uncharacterized protein (DUF362 family)
MINRRDFLATTATTLLATAVTGDLETIMAEPQKQKKATISLVKSSDRSTAVGRAISMLDVKPVTGKQLLIKPNFNTADPFPASTHNDTLEQLIVELKKMVPRNITIGERSGPPKTADVLRNKGIPGLCAKHEVGLINFEELPEDDWVNVKPVASHWRNGFDVARPVLAADSVVATCCLKTHQYGGVFTMALKLSVGITHKRNMAELHGAARNMRKMIAEINQVYRPDFILMDGIEVFTDRGPMRGVKRQADVMVAGSDPVAVDVVGLAILKEVGANDAIMGTKVFRQQQIARAVELDLGISRPQDIEIITDDAISRKYADRIYAVLEQEAA